MYGYRMNNRSLSAYDFINPLVMAPNVDFVSLNLTKYNVVPNKDFVPFKLQFRLGL